MMVSVLERILPSARDAAKAVVVERRDEALVIARAGVEERIALGEIRQGWIEDVSGEGDACDVLLRLRNGRDVAVRVTSRAEGESLLRAARVSVADRVLRVPLRSLASSQRFGELMGVVSLALLLPFLFAGCGGLIWAMTVFLSRGGPTGDLSGVSLLVTLLLTLSALSLLGVRSASAVLGASIAWVPHANGFHITIYRQNSSSERPERAIKNGISSSESGSSFAAIHRNEYTFDDEPRRCHHAHPPALHAPRAARARPELERADARAAGAQHGGYSRGDRTR